MVLRGHAVDSQRERENDMTIQEFIDENKDALDRCIKSVCPNCDLDDDGQREMWIMNDEGLYLWARSAGVDVDGEGAE